MLTQDEPLARALDDNEDYNELLAQDERLARAPDDYESEEEMQVPGDSEEYDDDPGSDTITVSKRGADTPEESPVPEFEFIADMQDGWTFHSPIAVEEWKSFMRNNNLSENHQSDNPYYPWRHEGEVWLSNFLFGQGHASMETSDRLLRQFVTGNMTMKDGPIQFKNTRQMYDVLDIAASANRVSEILK